MRTQRAFWTLLIIIILSFSVRTYRIGNPSFTFDELSTLAWTSSNMNEDKYVPEPYKPSTSVKKIIEHSFSFQYPPAYYIFVWSWVLSIGKITEGPIRMITVLISIVGIIYTFFLGKLYFNKKAGLISALLFSLLPFSIIYSREAVNYHLTCTFFLMSMYYFAKLLKGNCRSAIIFYLVSSLLLIFTNNYGVLALIIQGVVIVFQILIKKRLQKHLLISSTLLIAIMIPYLKVYSSFALKRGLIQNSAFSPISFFNNLAHQYLNVIGRSFFYTHKPLIAMVLISVLIAIGLFKLILLREFTKVIHLFSWILAPFIATSIFPNVFRAKCFTIVIPPVLMLIGYSVSFPRKRLWKLTGVLALCFLLYLNFNFLYLPNTPLKGSSNFRGIAEFLKRNALENDTILISHSYPAPVLQYYLIHKDVYPIHWRSNSEVYPIINKTKRVWYFKINEAWRGYNNQLEEILDEHYNTKKEIFIPPTKSNYLILYEK